MKNKLEQIVENLLIKEFQPLVENVLLNETEIKQLNVPDLVAPVTIAGQSLKPFSSQTVATSKMAKKLFKVIKTTPLVYNLIQLGLIDPQQLLGQAEGEQDSEESEQAAEENQQPTD